MHLLRCFKSSLAPFSTERLSEDFPYTQSWFYTLLSIGCFLCAVDFHAPFVALTVVAALTLNRLCALWCVGIFGLIHQTLGHGIAQVQPSMAAVEWELVVTLALGCVLVTTSFFKDQWMLVGPSFSFKGWKPWVVVTLTLSLSFLIFEGLIIFFWLGQGGHGFTAGVLIHLFTKELMLALILTGLWMVFRKFTSPKMA